VITLRQRASSATRGDKAVQMAVHGGWARCDPWSSRMLAGGMPPPPLSLPGVLACLLLEPAGNGTGWGGLLVEVGAGLGQGVLEWVGAGGSAVPEPQTSSFRSFIYSGVEPKPETQHPKA